MAMSAEPMIEVRELTKSFGAVDAVAGVSFRVHRGEIVGFLGPNGAGKTRDRRFPRTERGRQDDHDADSRRRLPA